MCLTVPAQIVKLEKGKGKAFVRDIEGIKEIKIALFPNLKVGDWILYISDLAIKKISKRDAEEIVDLFKKNKVSKSSKITEKFRKIIEASKFRDLKKEEIIYLLNCEGKEKEALYSEANLVRKIYLKDFICIHGIIEFSNFCKNDCLYCGLRNENKDLKRYRMSVAEIVDTAKKAVKKGYKILVLQSGEDYFYTDEILCQLIKKIKENCRVFIFMSVGERGYQCYKKMKEAGASGVLFRFETSNQKLFKMLHPKGKNFQSRFEHLKFIKKLGYFIATGSLIGLPGQNIFDLADDILEMKKWANMISMGPFVPCKNTPLANSSPGNVETNLKMIAILRLLMRDVRIPVTTALETLGGKEIRKKALLAGANALMFDLTPAKYRPLYKIYDKRFYERDNFWEKYGLFKFTESYKMLEERMQKELAKKLIYAKG